MDIIFKGIPTMSRSGSAGCASAELSGSPSFGHKAIRVGMWRYGAAEAWQSGAAEARK